ncbi:MAG TPA: CBS domain-containing protein [Candidatus Dormibacteraeota bacterium]
MEKTVRDVMTSEPTTLPASSKVSDAAAVMAEHNVGALVITKGDTRVVGILTDRDIVVRGIAARRDPWTTLVAEILSGEDLATTSPDTPVQEVVAIMRAKSVRRLPVIEKGRLVGIVSLGDLAIEVDPQSALADVSGASANR